MDIQISRGITSSPPSPPSVNSQRQPEMDSISVNHDDGDRETPEVGNEEELLTQKSTARGKRKQKSTAPEQSNAKRTLPTRSGVWAHFTRLEDNYDRCICNYCKKDLGTTNLRNHNEGCKAFKAWEDGQTTSQGQKVINKEGQLQRAKVSEKVFREATNQMLVIGELPMSFVESVAFRHFCNKVNLYKPHSRRTATRDIVQMYVERKSALRQWFVANKQRVSLTTDIWVSQVTGDSYMVITAHYIDRQWRLNSMIIGFKYVTDHKGKTISAKLLECLAEWGIEKVFCVTVDNATANSNGLSKFQASFSLLSDESLVMNGDYMHMRCAGHIINLIVRDGLADVDDSVTAIRNSISYVRFGTNRRESFEQKVTSGRMTRGSLPLDVKTRWNSTYLMLKSAVKFKGGFDRMEAEDKLYNDHFLEVDNGTKRIGPPSRDDWRSVGRLLKFLSMFYQSTLIVSASTTVNAHKCYGEIVNIASKLSLLACSFDSGLKVKAEEMFQKFDKYWDGLKNINKMVLIVSVFDPRKKMQFASMCFDELYGEGSTTSKGLKDSVLAILRDMYEEYSERYTRAAAAYAQQPQDQDQSQSSSQTLSQSTQEHQTDRIFDSVDDELFDDYNPVEQRYNTLLREIGVRDTNELEAYLMEKVENPELMMGIEFDVLSWWKANSGKYPILSEMARDLFAMQMSSVASESAFSTSGRIIEPYRSCLTHYMVEVLMCTEQWMKQDIKFEAMVLTNAQILAEVQYEDELEREFGTLNLDQ